MSTNLPRPNRRALVHGAAWAVPATLVASAAPALASSCETVTQTKEITAPRSNVAGSGPSLSEDFTVPAGVTEMTFEVLGGGGGNSDDPRNNADLGNTGGHGALITGTLAVTPGQVLRLIAGNGGIGGEGWNLGTFVGGRGYGNGGDTAGSSGQGSSSAASGGAGSAILLGTQPLVIAGGGGGASNVSHYSTPSYDATGYSGGNGGNSALQGTGGVDQRITGRFPTGLAEGGGGASGATPGAVRGTNASGGSGSIAWRTIVGRPGSAPAAGGGIGGTGVLSQAYTNNGYTWVISSAGGGGGYAGGASGTTQARTLNDGSTEFYTYVLGGAGGAGSSFVSPTAVTSSQVASGANGAENVYIRNPGRVKLTWEACPPGA